MNRSMKPFQNLFTHKISVIKLAVKGMQSAKFYAIVLVLVMLAGIFSLSPAISSLMKNVMIRSTGSIATPTTAPIAYRSEIRGIFIDGIVLSYPHDWNVIADTLASYGINIAFLSVLNFDSKDAYDEWDTAISTLHSKGIQVYLCMNCFFIEWNAYPELQCVHHDGSLSPDWICPIKGRDHIKELVEEAATHNWDGFMFDYIRYSGVDQCYCDYCKAAFEEWLGEGPITDWTPFYPGGSRHQEFINWRVTPITELVRDVRDWMLAINPNLKFAASVFTLGDDCPTYWRYYIGQDTADWIRQDYLDFVSPMMYTTEIYGSGETLESFVTTCQKYLTGGVEGKIPLVPFITTGINEAVPPDTFKAEVDYLRSKGVDGWIIWRYGGPGVEDGSMLFDITEYLSIIDLPQTFTLENIEVSAGETQATITWTTDLLATSKVEYNTSSLFTANFVPGWHGGSTPYWDIDHVLGTVVEDATPVTEHGITLTGLLPRTQYYFRVQSQDSSGIATSKVLTFTTGE